MALIYIALFHACSTLKALYILSRTSTHSYADGGRLRRSAPAQPSGAKCLAPQSQIILFINTCMSRCSPSFCLEVAEVRKL